MISVSEEEAIVDIPAIVVIEPIDVGVPVAHVVAIHVANRDTLYALPSIALAKATARRKFSELYRIWDLEAHQQHVPTIYYFLQV